LEALNIAQDAAGALVGWCRFGVSATKVAAGN